MSSTSPPEALRRIEECRKTKGTKLNLSSCDLKEIPTELADLVWLKSLALSDNKISEIKNLDALSSLTVLKLHVNKISEIKNLDALSSLTVLNLWSNKISEIKNLKSLSSLTGLDISSNKISEIKNLDALTVLMQLNLSYNQISEIKNVDALSSLTVLSLWSNKISEIKNLESLSSLTGLDLSSNKISEIKNLDELSGLKVLNLWSNLISEIKNLDELTALTRLSLSHNQISEIKNLESLTALAGLDLTFNQISEIKNLESLTALTQLDLSGNQISRLPNSLIFLFERIEQTDLSENPIEGTTITDWKNPKAILGYLQGQQDIQVTNYHLKVNIIGEGRIGKTQLFNFWKKRKKYKPNDEPTHGTLTTQYTFPDRKHKATIWDFGGQAYHHGFHHVFLRPNDFYLVLWRNKQKKKDYGYWLGTARNFSRPSQKEYIAPVVLLQNVWNETDNPEKQTTHTADLIDFPDSQKMEKYKVTLDNVFAIDVKYLHQNNPDWKDRHEYFMRSLHRMIKAHTEKLLPTVSEKWLMVKEQLDETPIEQIDLKKVEFCEQHASGFDEAALAGLLDYLEFTGNIIKFPEPSRLADYVFPNPPFLADWIYNDVLSKEFKKSKKGILDYARLEERIGKEKAKIFREIMDEFHLLFPEKGEKNNLVIPQFLPENNNTFKRLILELIPYSFCLRFDDYFHESRIFQFISEYGEYADDNTSYWRYGLVFTFSMVNTLVYYNQEERTVFVHIEQKPGRVRIAQEVFDYFVYREKKKSHEEKRLSYYAMRYQVGIGTLAEIIRTRKIKIKTDPNAIVSEEGHDILRQEYQWEEGTTLSSSVSENRKRKKLDPDDLIEGAQLSINRKYFIDIKEALRSNAEEIPVGIDVESRQKIKLDSLTLNLLGLMNQELPKVFISYSRQDLLFKDELRVHLSSLERYDLIKAWDCNEIRPGGWESQIQTNLEEADILVYMVSQNFMHSDYIMEKEVKRGIQMVKDNPDKKIICVLVRDCVWRQWSFMEETFKDILEQEGDRIFSDSMDLSKFQFLPYYRYRVCSFKCVIFSDVGIVPNPVAENYRQLL